MMLSQRMAARCLVRWMITLDRRWLVEAIEWHRLRLEIDASNAKAKRSGALDDVDETQGG